MSTAYKWAIELWEHFILKYRWGSLLLSLCVVALMGYGAQHLGFSTDYRVFFGKDNPELLAFEKLQNVFSKDDNVMMVLEPKSGEVFEKEHLKILKDLTEEAWMVPFSTRVDSITNFQHTEGTDDELIVRDLVEDPEMMDANALKKAKRVALNEPLLIHRLINENSSVSAINITVELPGISLDEVPKVAKAVRDMRDRVLEQHPDVNIYLTGMVMLNNAFAEAGQIDMMTLNPIMFAVIFILIAILTRSIAGTLGTLLVIVFSTIGAMGLAGYMGIKLTPTSITATTVIMTLAVADCIHIVVSVVMGLRNGLQKVEAIKDAIKSNALPVFITSVTTAIGFLSLNFSDSPPYHDYGNITALGVMLAFLLSIVFLPAFLLIVPMKTPVLKPENASHKPRGFAALADVVIAHHRMFRWAMVVLVIVLATGVSKITLNDQFVEYFSPKVEFRSDTDAVMKKLTGIYNLSFALETELDGGISNPQYIEVVERFAQYLRTEENVVHVNSITDTYKRLNKNMNNDRADAYRLPEEQDLAAQYILLYEMSLPLGLDLNSTINTAKDSSKLVATLKNSSTVELRELEDRSNAWLQQHGAGIVSGKATSPSVMFSHISKRNIESMISGTAISMVLITIIMIVALASWRYGMISLIPNMLPLLMTFGLWGYLEGLVDMGVATIAGLTIGIVVDDTVHFMIKYLRAKRKFDMSAEDAIRYAFVHVGPAIAITSMILVAGFMVMSASTFRMNWTMGVMSAMTIAFALLVDMLLLPPLLSLFDRCSSKKTF